jgi:hypothetical protein
MSITSGAAAENLTKPVRSLNNLAGVLHAHGDLDAAHPLFERTLAIPRLVWAPTTRHGAKPAGACGGGHRAEHSDVASLSGPSHATLLGP